MRPHQLLLSVIGTVPKRSEFEPNSRHVITSNESNSNKLLKMEAKSTAERRVHRRHTLPEDRPCKGLPQQPISSLGLFVEARLHLFSA